MSDKNVKKRVVKELINKKKTEEIVPTFLGYFLGWSAQGKRSGEIIQTPEMFLKWLQEDLGISNLKGIEVWSRESFNIQYGEDDDDRVFFEAKDAEEFQEAVEMLVEKTECKVDVIIKPLYSSNKSITLFYGREF